MSTVLGKINGSHSRPHVKKLWLIVALIFMGTLNFFGRRSQSRRSLMLANFLPVQDDTIGHAQETDANVVSNIITRDYVMNLATAEPVNEKIAPVHWHSSWMGNQWIPPPGYKLYSSLELRNYFGNHSVLFIGDSTSRRSYLTLYPFLQALEGQDVQNEQINSLRILNTNRDRTTERCAKEGYMICRPMPGPLSSLSALNNNHTALENAMESLQHSSPQQHDYDLILSRCLGDVRDLWMTNATSSPQIDFSKYSFVVISIGPWEYTQRGECIESTRKRFNITENVIRSMIQLSEEFASTKFVWRTWAGPGQTRRTVAKQNSQWKYAQAHNHLVKTLIHKYQIEQYQNQKPWTGVSYVDWGQVMGPRLFPQSQRIAAVDIDEHHGLEARLAFIQMLINHLVQQERMEKLGLGPWWLLEDGRKGLDSADDCLRAGGMPKYCLTPEDLTASYKSFLTFETMTSSERAAALEQAEEDFCEDCLWNSGTSCGARLEYLLKKSSPRPFALQSVMERPACNRTNPRV